VTRLRALVEWYVDGRTVPAGGELEVDEVRASAFVAYGIAEPVESEQAPAEHKPRARKRTAE
jgi:hypothetical protein